MADVGRVKKLDILGTIQDGISIGLENIGPIFMNFLLWVLTCWIPYLNVGTTIGLWVGIISKAGGNESISMTEIFDSKYRKYMGEFFLTYALISIGVSVGFAFLIIPGIVISIAWSLALLLVIDKGKNPTEAITLSNNYTYGNKGRIFWIYFLVLLVFGIASFVITYLIKHFDIIIVGVIIGIVIIVFFMLVLIGIQASIYKKLVVRRAS